MPKVALRPIFYGGLWLFAVMLACRATAQEPGERGFADGPLLPRDFRGAVPNPRPEIDGVHLRAFLSYDIRHRFRYRTMPSARTQPPRDGQPAVAAHRVAIVERVILRTIALPEKSWFVDASDLRLLDHEQGHLDLCELLCRELQRQFDKLLAGGGVIKAQGATDEEAVSALDKEVERLLRQFAGDGWTAEQNKYDRETNHGLDPVAQRRWRDDINKRLAAKG